MISFILILVAVSIFSFIFMLYRRPNSISEFKYITPKPFNTGYLPSLPQKIANVCTTNDVMYPVPVPYVKYGKHKYINCDVLKFNSPP